MISKMEDRGSRIGIVLNGSSLWTGDAGGGESEIRRWIIENDWLECIVSLPNAMFFNKGIPKRWWLQKLLELPGYYVKGPRKNRFSAYRSLRASMKDWKPEPLTQSEENLIPLQLGR